MILNLFTNTLSCTISNIIVFDFLEKYFKRQYSYSIFIPFVLLTVFQISVNMLQNTELNYLYTILFFFVISKFLYYDEKYNIYLISFFIICGLMFIESFAFIFINTLFKTNVSNPYLYSMQVVLSLILTLLSYYILIKCINSQKLKIDKFNYIETFMIFLNLIGTFSIIDIAGKIDDKTILLILLLISVCFLFSNVYFIFVIDLKNKFNQLNTDLELKKYIEEVKHKSYVHRIHQIEKEEKYFHDLKNHLNVLNYYYQSQQFDNAQNYLEKIINNVPKTQRIISNDIIQVILYEYKEDCIKYNIEFNTHINKTLSFNKIDEFDLVTLYSNLLSNAFEAARNSKTKKIEIHIDRIDNFIVTKICNTYNNKIEEKNNIFKSTKDGHKGHGISNVIDVINKYKGTYYINYDQNSFVFQFVLPETIYVE